MKQTKSGLYVPGSYETADFGYRGRDSVTTIETNLPAFGFLSPTELGSWDSQRLTVKELAALPVPEMLATLVRNSDVLSRALQIYQNLGIQSYDILPEEEGEEGDRSVQIAKDFIKRIEVGNTPFINQLRNDMYNIKVEGAIALELYFDRPGGTAVGLEPISPFSLRFLRTESAIHKIYYRVVQYKDGNLYDDPIVLQDRENPNPTFVYVPVNQVENKPYGTPPFLPAIGGILTRTSMVLYLQQIVAGASMARGIISIPSTQFENTNTQNASNATEKAIKSLKENLSKSDASQLALIDTEFVYEAIEAINATGANGAEILFDVVMRGLQYALAVPEAILKTRRRGGLGNNEHRSDILVFESDLLSVITPIEDSRSQLLNEVVSSEGQRVGVRLVIYSDTTEIDRIQEEARQAQIDRYLALEQRGILSKKEVRGLTIKTDPNLTDFDTDIPEGAVEQPESNPEGTRNGSTDD